MATLVIPWRGGDIHREKALGWLRARHPDIRLGEAPAGAWSKATAIYRGLEGLTGIVAVSDADAWVDLAPAIKAVENGAPWAKPHRYVFRLTEEASEWVYEGAEPHESLGWEERHLGLSGGGVVVAPAETLRAVPPDPRFLGWGHEDLAWGQALHVLAGEGWRGAGSLYHLWHPPQDRRNRRMGSANNYALFKRYAKARRNPDDMKGLIEEAHVALRTTQSPGVPSAARAGV